MYFERLQRIIPVSSRGTKVVYEKRYDPKQSGEALTPDDFGLDDR